MINKKNLFTIIIFLFITCLVLLQAFTVRKFKNSEENFIERDTVEKTFFKNVSFFITKNGQDNTELHSESLEVTATNGNRKMNFDKVIGKQISNNDWIEWKALKALYRTSPQDLSLNGNVEFKNAQANYKTEVFYYNIDKQFVEAKESVKSVLKDMKTEDTLKVNSNYMSSWPSEKRILFLGNVQGNLSRKLKYQAGMKFAAEKMEYQQLLSQMHLEKNVSIDRNNYHLESQKADIFLENYNKKLKYYVLYDDIKLEEKMSLTSGERRVRRAFSEKLEGFISENKTVLTGAPRVEQGEDVIKGYQITLRENVEIVEVDDSQSSFKLKRDN